MSEFDDFDFDGVVRELDGDNAVLQDESPGPTIRERVADRPYKDTIQAEFETMLRAASNSPSRDEFYHFVEAQLERARNDNTEAGFVGNPPSAMEQSNLGDDIVLTSDTTIQQKPLCRWQGKDSETGPVTVTVGMVNLLVSTTGAVVRPFLILKWGTFGQSFYAEIDVGTGRQLTINASMIEVDGALEAETTSNTAKAQIKACLSFKPMVRTSPVIRTRYIDSLAQGGGAAVTVIVPPYATGLLPVQMSDIVTPGVLQLDFIDSSNTIRYSLLISPGAQVTPIPLTGDIVAVKVTNTSAVAQHVRLPFELSI